MFISGPKTFFQTCYLAVFLNSCTLDTCTRGKMELNPLTSRRQDRNHAAWMWQSCDLLTFLLLVWSNFLRNQICYGFVVAMDFIQLTTSWNVADFLAAVAFFPDSSPAFQLDYGCDSYHDALVVHRSSLLYVEAIFLVGPAETLLSDGILLKTLFGAQATNVGVFFESDG